MAQEQANAWWEAWLDALPAEARLKVVGRRPDIAHAFVEAARQGSVAFEPGALLAHAASRTPTSTPDPLAHLQQMAAADLALAKACAEGDPTALSHFEANMAADLRMVYANARGRKPPFDEFAQHVRTRLLTGDEPRIGRYAGLGALKNWVRVSASRALIDLQRKTDHDFLTDEQAAAVPTPDDDPETDYLKRLYRAELSEAFEEAVTELSAEQRNCLRDYYARRLTVDQIATARGIHRATAARHVAAARAEVLRLTRQRLMQRTKLSQDELASVVRLIESQLYVSVQRVFAEP